MTIPTPKTTLNLTTRVLRELRVLPKNEQPTAEQRETVEDAYASIYEELSVHALAYWPQDEIPVVVFRPLVQVIARELAPTYNKAYEAPEAMQRLRAVVAKPWSGRPVRSQYY